MTMVKFNQRPGFRTFDNLFDDFFNTLPSSWTTGNRAGNLEIPQVNIFETTDGYHLEMNVPGRNKEDFSIQVENDQLTISFEKKEEKNTAEYKTIRREFSYRSFRRSFSLDDSIQPENIQAKYENGLLKLFLPKKVVSQPVPRQINVQ